MNFYRIYRGFYVIETGFYDIEVGVYEIDRQVYEIDGWFDAMASLEDQMLLLRHHRSTADVEPVRGSLLRGLVARGLVRSTGQRRWVCYELVSGELRASCCSVLGAVT